MMQQKSGNEKYSVFTQKSNREEDGGSHAKRISFQDIAQIQGVTPLTPKTTPSDLIKHTRPLGGRYKVKQYYQLDNIQRYRSWQELLRRIRSKERWLFYPCPLECIHEALTSQVPVPYSEFFPRVFGKSAIYLFESFSQSARVALKFGVEKEGMLISCRVLTGKVFWAKKPYPEATVPPRGYDTVAVKSGTDLGFGPIRGDMVVIYNPDMILMRYATYIIT